MKTIVTCMGEGLIDFVPLTVSVQRESIASIKENNKVIPATKGLSTDFRLSPGGSIFNVAVGIARLGQHAAFAGKISKRCFWSAPIEGIASK